uniref:Uncharacterized protein n=1 Tax=Periophthalmus magnuspinnatus TaxID=409849 RepID=A0A3B3ZWX9_9GOBI
PFYGIVALMRWFFSHALFLLDFNFCGLWHSDYFVEHKQKKVEAYIPCETGYPGFMNEPSVKEANSLIKCGRCQMFVVQQVPDSNLVLVVTQADCDCSRQYGPILLQPKEIKNITPHSNVTGSHRKYDGDLSPATPTTQRKMLKTVEVQTPSLCLCPSSVHLC